MNWQPIETMPLDTTVLLYEPARELWPGYTVGPYVLVCDTFGSGKWSPACINGFEWECEMERPTHWAPLPELPNND